MALETCECRENQLTRLPAALGRCSRLIELNVVYNQLTSIPELGLSESLKQIHLYGNPVAAGLKKPN